MQARAKNALYVSLPHLAIKRSKERKEPKALFYAYRRHLTGFWTVTLIIVAFKYILLHLYVA